MDAKYQIGLLLVLLGWLTTATAQSVEELDSLSQVYGRMLGENPKDGFNGLKGLEKAANFKNSRRGQMLLGLAYYDGLGTFTDRKAGMGYFRQAAALGEVDAYTMISIHYSTYPPKEMKEHQEYCKMNLKGAEEGSVMAMWQLYYIYTKGGVCVWPNPKTGLEWLKKAAEKGNEFACLDLGELYYNGDGVDQDYNMVFRLIKQAAEQNNTKACVRLYQLYRDGKGVQQSCKEGLKWLDKALEKNNAQAQYEKGLAFETGTCLSQNKYVAKEFFRMAATQGYTPAKNKLNPPSNSTTSSAPIGSNSSSSNTPTTYSAAIDYYHNELNQYGTVFKGNVQQGKSYTMKFGLRGEHEVRLIVNEGTRPGYYPMIKMTYYDYNDEVLGSYTSDVSDVKRINDNLTVLDITINAPRYSKRVDFSIVRGAGYLLSVMD